jgi:hypothetical protein
VFLPIGSFSDLAFNLNDELVLVDVIVVEDAIIPPDELNVVMLGAVAGALLLLMLAAGAVCVRMRRRAPVGSEGSATDHSSSDGFSQGAYGRAYSDLCAPPSHPSA